MHANQSSLATRIRDASNEDLLNQDLLRELNGVFTAVVEAAKKHKSFRKALPYQIKEKPDKVLAAVANVANANLNTRKAEGAVDDAVHRLLNHINDGGIDFWNPHCQHGLTSRQTEFLSSKGYTCITLCFVLQDSEIHHIILRRFARVVVYRLSNKCGRTPQTISEDLQEAGLNHGKSLMSLIKDVTAFISAGRRYTTFANELGGFGALFFLPCVGHTAYEQYIPVSGLQHDEALQRLRDEGIHLASQPFHNLANDLLRRGSDAALIHAPRWEPVQSYVYTLEDGHPTSKRQRLNGNTSFMAVANALKDGAVSSSGSRQTDINKERRRHCSVGARSSSRMITNSHGGCQILDVAGAASVLESLQQSHEGSIRGAAEGLHQPEQQPSVPSEEAYTRQHGDMYAHAPSFYSPTSPCVAEAVGAQGTFRGGSVTADDGQARCHGSPGPDASVVALQHPETSLNHQAVINSDVDADVTSESLQSSGRTNNHDSHATLGTGRAAMSQRQEHNKEQETNRPHDASVTTLEDASTVVGTHKDNNTLPEAEDVTPAISTCPSSASAWDGPPFLSYADEVGGRTWEPHVRAAFGLDEN